MALRAFKLADGTGDGLSPYVNRDGAFLGQGTPLLERDAGGLWRPRPRAVLQRLLDVAYEGAVEPGRRIDALASVARALNAGDLTRAAMTLLYSELPPLPDADRARKLAAADALLKYSPDQPRVPAGSPDGGEWSDEFLGIAQRMSPRFKPPTNPPKPPPKPAESHADGDCG